MTKSQKIYAVLIMLAFLLPNLYIIAVAEESYPFTPAPMFGHYIGNDTYFYGFDFIAENDAQKKLVAPSHPANIELHSRRFLLSDVYGCAEPGTPFEVFKKDSKTELEKRLAKYFSLYFKDVEKDSAHYVRVRFVINQFNRQFDQLATHEVGYYHFATKKFVHTWQGNQ